MEKKIYIKPESDLVQLPSEATMESGMLKDSKHELILGDFVDTKDPKEEDGYEEPW